MKLVKICTEDVDRIAPLVAAFRVQLKSYKMVMRLANIIKQLMIQINIKVVKF